jgi:dATP pyrophosphohydrolase
LDVLLLERADHPGFWQSVTGSRATADEALRTTCVRELAEETGVTADPEGLEDWQITHRYEIYPHWRHRYAPGVTHNVEHVFGFCVPQRFEPGLHPAEHTYTLAVRRDAADACFSDQRGSDPPSGVRAGQFASRGRRRGRRVERDGGASTCAPQSHGRPAPRETSGIRALRDLRMWSARASLRATAIVVVEHRGAFHLLFFEIPVRVLAQHEPFERVIARSQPGTVDGAAQTLRDFSGTYVLTVIGRDRRAGVRLDYESKFELVEPLPPVLGQLFGTAMVARGMRQQFEAMVHEIERRQAARPPIERSG